jgi:flagellar biosynthesis protein FlhF
MELAREVLVEQWHRFATRAEQPGLPARVLVGAPGVGKTTALCKWVTQETFLRQRPARLWRLDGAQPNTAEFLSLHGEMMQVPVERVWTDSLDVPEDTLRFVDLPGVPATEARVEELAAHLKPLGPAEVQLVLNSAYDLELLLEQARVFSALPLAGLIFTHTDESDDWSKLWNVALASELPVTFRSGGQAMPGGFQAVLPETLFDQWVSTAMQG